MFAKNKRLCCFKCNLETYFILLVSGKNTAILGMRSAFGL